MSTLLEQASLVMIPSGYKEDIVYSPVPTNGNGDLSFTRASNGTRINSAGLVEVTPWNLLQQSETIGGSAWAVVGYTQTTNATTAPNGTNTAELFTLNNGNVAGPSYAIYQPLVFSGEITISVYFKNNNSTGKYVLQTGASQGSEINVVTLAINNFAGCVGSVENVGNGWYRFSTFIPSASNPYFFSYQDGMTGDGSKGIYLWGAQINTGALKPYFPTTDRLNVPRLTYQNGGGGCPSLLLEKQSTNEWLNSQDVTAWSNLRCTVTANQAISPDGTQNADRVDYQDYNGNWDIVYQGTFTVTGTFSIWLKTTDGSTKTINLTWGAPDPSRRVIWTVTGEWQRYTAQINASSQNVHIGNFESLDPTWTARSFYMWGAQLEASSYPTSYIPTTSSSATRVADACYKTGISSLIGQSQGTFFLDANIINPISPSGNVHLLMVGTTAERITIFIGGFGTTINADGLGSGGGFAAITGALTLGRNKIAVGYANNNVAFYVNGTLIGTQTTATIPSSMSQVDVGGNYTYANYIGSNTYNEVVFFPTRLTNAELASLTTI